MFAMMKGCEVLLKHNSSETLSYNGLMVMTTSPLVKTYTLQEFWDLPEPAERSKLELIKGVLYMTPPPGHPHNQAAADLNQQLVNALTKAACRGTIFVPRAATWA